MKILYDRYKAEGLEILAFPCNNFASQEPGTKEEIQEFARQKGAEYESCSAMPVLTLILFTST